MIGSLPATRRSLPNSLSEPRWLEPTDIVELNRIVVSATGEPHQLLDYGLLDSACWRPRNLHFYDRVDDAWSLAVELLFGIARNHAFEQGNKRTAFEAAIVFLELNGYALDMPDTEIIAELIIAAIVDPEQVDLFARAVGTYVVELPD